MAETQEINPSMNGFNEDTQPEITETQSVNEDIVELSKDIQKPKKPRSEKQIAALKKAQETRKRNAEIRKQQKEQLKQAIKDNEETQPVDIPQEQIQPVRRTRKPKVIYEEDPSSDEEVIVVKRKPRRKKKKKVIFQDETSSEEEVYQKPKRGRKKKPQPKPETESSESEDDYYEYDNQEAYQYPVNRPLKYSDVFRFV